MPRLSSRLWSWLFSAILCSTVPTTAAADASAYTLGRGYPVGDSGIRLGGYASLVVAAPRSGGWSFDVSDLSLFITAERGRWRFFSETEVGEALTAGEHRNLSDREAHFELERLYVDYIVDDRLAVRFGKFLTPLSRWNLLHANPLVWTTTRPVSTESLFAKNATGLMFYGSVPVAGRSLNYSVFGIPDDAIEPYRSRNSFENAYGARLSYGLTEQFEVSLSYANFRLHDQPRRRFNWVGAEFLWSWRRFEVSGEWLVRSGVGRDLWQGHVQGVVPLSEQFYAVVRHEFYQQPQQGDAQVGVFGLAFRPRPPLVWKLEYRLGTHNEQTAPDGLYGSFAVLF